MQMKSILKREILVDLNDFLLIANILFFIEEIILLRYDPSLENVGTIEIGTFHTIFMNCTRLYHIVSQNGLVQKFPHTK